MSSAPFDNVLEEAFDYDVGAPTSEPLDESTDASLLIAESHKKTLPVNILWMISTAFGILTIVWAMIAAVCNRRGLGAKELPYIGFLLGNLLVLLVVEVPDIIIFTTGQPVHNEWTKFIYDTVNNMPLFNLAWIGLQNLLHATRPEWLTVQKSFAMGAALWLSGIAISLPLSIAFSAIEDEEYMTKFIPLFIVSFLLQKGLPLAMAVITTILANITVAERIHDYNDNKPRQSCWVLFEQQTRSYMIDLIAIIIYTFVWISEDVHVMVYLFNGTTLGGLELYHIAIYNLIETTAIFLSGCLTLLSSENLRVIRSCRQSALEDYNVSVANLLATKTDDPESAR